MEFHVHDALFGPCRPNATRASDAGRASLDAEVTSGHSPRTEARLGQLDVSAAGRAKVQRLRGVRPRPRFDPTTLCDIRDQANSEGARGVGYGETRKSILRFVPGKTESSRVSSSHKAARARVL
jgi:hypothetical protein